MLSNALRRAIKHKPIDDVLNPLELKKHSADLELQLMAINDPLVTDETRFDLETQILNHVNDLIEEDTELAVEFLRHNKDRFSADLKPLLSDMINSKKAK